MKTRLFLLGVAAGFVGTLAGGCHVTPDQWKSGENALLSAAQVACIIGQAESDDSTVQQVCGIEQALMPVVRNLIGAQRAESRRFAAAAHVGACDKK